MNAPTFPTTLHLMEKTRSASDENTAAKRLLNGSKPLHILVVEGDSAVRQILVACLERDGHQVETADDGVSGFNRFWAGTWDLVFLARTMPRMHGGQLAFAIKQLNAQVPVVMLTSVPDVNEELDGYAEAIDVIVRKPFTLQRLRDGISRAAGEAEAA